MTTRAYLVPDITDNLLNEFIERDDNIYFDRNELDQFFANTGRGVLGDPVFNAPVTFLPIVALLRQLYAGNETRFIELGASIGTLLNMISEFIPNLSGYGIEIDQDYVNYAQQHDRKVYQGDITNVFRPDNSEPLLIATNIFDGSFSPFTDNRQEYMDEVARVLAPGGSLVVQSFFSPKFNDQRFNEINYLAEFCQDVFKGPYLAQLIKKE